MNHIDSIHWLGGGFILNIFDFWNPSRLTGHPGLSADLAASWMALRWWIDIHSASLWDSWINHGQSVQRIWLHLSFFFCPLTPMRKRPMKRPFASSGGLRSSVLQPWDVRLLELVDSWISIGIVVAYSYYHGIYKMGSIKWDQVESGI